MILIAAAVLAALPIFFLFLRSWSSRDAGAEQSSGRTALPPLLVLASTASVTAMAIGVVLVTFPTRSETRTAPATPSPRLETELAAALQAQGKATERLARSQEAVAAALRGRTGPMPCCEILPGTDPGPRGGVERVAPPPPTIWEARWGLGMLFVGLFFLFIARAMRARPRPS